MVRKTQRPQEEAELVAWMDVQEPGSGRLMRSRNDHVKRNETKGAARQALTMLLQFTFTAVAPVDHFRPEYVLGRNAIMRPFVTWKSTPF
jgi:hypothetical protein